MEFEKIEVKLRTNKNKGYLWNKINTPEKIIEIEEMQKDTEIIRITDDRFELKEKNVSTIITFIPQKAVNMMIVYEDYSLLAWFEIKGEENCTIIHSTYRIKRLKGQENTSEKELEKNRNELRAHFMEELKFIAK